jgi:predicted DsbA family dithiol-disulfide isomerase
MHITFVKKIKTDGTPCRKCAEVQARLEKDNYIQKINEIVIADESNKNSKGMRLAKEHGIEQAPFFIVDDEKKGIAIYTVYFKFINEIFNKKINEKEIAKEILDADHNLDYI